MTTYYPQLLASKILSDARASLAADNADVTNFIRGKFILAIQIGYNGKDTAASAYKLRWRNVTDSGSFADVAATGQCKYSATSAALTDGTNVTGPIGSGKTAQIAAVSGQTWHELGQENVNDNTMPDSSTLDLNSDSYTEMQWALDLSDALHGKQYEWQLYNVTAGAAVGTCASQITTIAEITGSVGATLAAVTSTDAGGPKVTGTATSTLAAVTSVAAGGPKVTGSVGATLPALTSMAEGEVTESLITGTVSATLGAITANVAGMPIITGTTLANLAPITASDNGQPIVTGQGFATLAQLSSLISGSPVVGGTISASLEKITALVRDSESNDIEGTISASLSAVRAKCKGAVVFPLKEVGSGLDLSGWCIVDVFQL